MEAIIAMLDMMLGQEGAFKKRPFMSFGACPVISPLRFAKDSLDVLIAAAKIGVPSSIAVASQTGSTSPTALAGSVVQVIAEALACLAVVNIIKPGYETEFGAWPFASDLRTGSFSGGSGEQALIAAATTQMANDYYDIPSGLAAGMTDAKIPDAQAGFEKGITITLAAMAGTNAISECAGMLGSLMGCGFDSLVMDNEMLGMINRTLRGIEVTEETLSFDVIKETVLGGSGHYLAHPQTQKFSRTEYYYPEIIDRSTSQQWLDAGAKDMRERSKEKAKEILATHYPTYIEPKVDDRIREHFPILLPKEAMRG
jgi:trimethylamine--corrinoid protein Co-methyltransferase